MDREQQPRGLLVSQIGYERAGHKRLVYRGPPGALGGSASFAVETEGGPAFTGALQFFGECWGTGWWVGDFTPFDAVGPCTVTVHDRGESIARASTRVGHDLLFRETWEAVSLGQAERRQWLVESRRGWYDAGTRWQEANSHAAFVLGLCELRGRRSVALAPEALARLDRQIANGCGYLGDLQDLATERGLGEGALVHQSFKFDHVVLTADAAKAAAAWARAAAIVDAPTHAAERETWRARARLALQWLEAPQPTSPVIFNGFAYGSPHPEEPPAGLPTTDLLMVLEAECALAGQPHSPAAVRWANELCARQVTRAEAQDAYYGMFRQFPDSTLTAKAWTHGMLADGQLPTDLGNTHGLYLFPLLRLAVSSKPHPDQGRWRDALHAFAYGYFLPAARLNPFDLCPNGHFPGHGPLNFAGLWHGANTMYGLAAALAWEFAEFFEDPAFGELATGNLQWIAGLNAGITRDTMARSILCEANVPVGAAVPVSMIHGIGTRTAGSWLNIRGSICNGFSVGDQFQWDVPPLRAADGPHAFTDEDWITHAGGWLTALARMPRAAAIDRLPGAAPALESPDLSSPNP